jgi:hypothetical protein
MTWRYIDRATGLIGKRGRRWRFCLTNTAQPYTVVSELVHSDCAWAVSKTSLEIWKIWKVLGNGSTETWFTKKIRVLNSQGQSLKCSFLCVVIITQNHVALRRTEHQQSSYTTQPLNAMPRLRPTVQETTGY